MRKILLIAIAAAFPFSKASAWVLKDSCDGGARSAAIGFPMGSAAFIGLGLDSNSYKRSLWYYNPGMDNWTQMTSLGGITGGGLDRNASMCFTVGTKAYVVGGQGANPFYDDTWEYDAVTNTWTQKQTFSGGGRRAGVAFSINGKGYIGLGQAATELKNDLWEYNPATNTWTAKANFTGSARRFAACFVINNKAYVGTGDNGAFTADFYEYNPTSNTWTAKANFGGTPRYSTVSFSLYGKGYVGLGYDNTLSNTDDIWEYDPIANTWVFKTTFPGSKRANATAVALQYKAYIGLGYDSLFRDDWWEFDPLIDGVNENILSENSFSFYPNPANDQITVNVDKNLTDSKAYVSLFALDGKRVIESQLITAEQFRLDVSGLQSGIYLLHIDAGGKGTATRKVIVH